jgi:hypothetical protein
MSAGVLERASPDVIAPPSLRRPLVSWKQPGIAVRTRSAARVLSSTL